MPMRALRSTPIRIISHRVAPSASTASRCECGTADITSRVSDEMMGKIMMARITPAERKPSPVGFASLKKPVQPSVLISSGFTYSRISGTSTKTAHNP